MLYSTDKGACCSNSYKAILILDGKEKEIFSGNGSGQIRANWVDSDHAVISVDKIYDYKLVSTNLRRNPLKSDGSENSVIIIFGN